MRFRFVSVLMLFAGWMTFAQEAEWYQGKPIKDIVFDGLQHVNTDELEGVIQPYIGRLFNDEVFWEITGRLYALEYFDLITPSAVPTDAQGSEVIIRFTVTERPTVSRITFAGNNGLSRRELIDVISLKVNDVVNELKLRVDEAEIVNKYQEKGYPDIQVRSETAEGKGGTVQVTFYITEGEKISIEEFVFEGNTIFSSRSLRGQLSLKTKGILNDGAFQEAKLTADRAAIVQYYRDRGYIDAAVTDVVRDLRKDDKGNNLMIITFRIYEGRIYTFGGVSFEGNEIFPTEQLEALIYSKIGDVVNARRVESDMQRIMNLYAENGYIFNSIVPNEDRNTAEGILSYKISIIERGRAHIEHIRIKGNEKTKTHVILREIPLEPGDVFSRTKLLEGQRNLMNLQYFSNVLPDMVPGSVESLMDLEFTVEEQPTTDIALGMTYSGTSDPDDFPISLQLKLNDRNFLGYGNAAGIEVSGSPDIQSLALEYTQQWIFGLPLSGGFDFTVRHATRQAAMGNQHFWFNGDEQYAYPDGFDSYQGYVNESKLPDNAYLMEYDQWSFSLGFSTGYRFSTFLGNLGVGGGVRTGLVRNSYDAAIYRPFDPTLRDGNNSWTWANSIWTTVSLDQRDVFYDPTKGYYAVQRLGFYGLFPFEREHYIKSDTKAEYFISLLNLPLTDTYTFKLSFGLHTGVSFILPQLGFSRPAVEDGNKLAVDGMFIGRGWINERLNRGEALWENWAELRWPFLPGILALDFFFDAAAVKETPEAFFKEFRMEDMRFSFGGGLRFAIPQFPFRFLLAKRFKIEDGELRWQDGVLWHDKPGSGLDFVISFAISTY
jgi:outer membrane protein insertion porin family